MTNLIVNADIYSDIYCKVNQISAILDLLVVNGQDLDGFESCHQIVYNAICAASESILDVRSLLDIGSKTNK